MMHAPRQHHKRKCKSSSASLHPDKKSHDKSDQADDNRNNARHQDTVMPPLFQ
jgi:hypothetical protein